MKKFYRFLLASVLVLVFSAFQVNAAIYYVSTSGNDANLGTSESLPWKTLTKVNSLTPKAGDQILFKRGDTWTGTITVKASGTSVAPITYDAWGEGPNPVISGFTPVTAWTNKGGNIWESTNAVSTLTYLNIVLVNGVNTPMGRTPNDGSVYTASAVSDDVYIQSASLTGTPNYTGAQVVMRKEAFAWQVSNVTSQTTNTLYYTDVYSSSYIAKAKMGFFIQAHSSTLDTQNEWYYNTSTKKLQIYSTSEPKGVSVPTVEYLMSDNYAKNYITFKNIEFTGANSTAIRFRTSTGITIDNCTVNNIGMEGIYLYNIKTPAITNNTFTNCNHSAISDWGSKKSTNTTITNNYIDSTYLIIGIGNLYALGAIHTNCDNSLVQYNTITNSGKEAIKFHGTHPQIKNNFIDYCLLKVSDGGGIYTSNQDGVNVIIDGNIVLNSIGYPLGEVNSYIGARGIYLDSGTTGVTVSNNTVAHCHDGINLASKTNNITVKNNIVFDNTQTGLNIYNSFGTSNATHDITVTGNQFVALSVNTGIPKFDDQLCMYLSSPFNDIPSFLSASSNNIFARPLLEDGTTIRISQPDYKNYISLATWQTWSGLDAGSAISPKTVSSEDDVHFLYNNTKQVKTFNLTGSNFKDIAGNTVSGSFTLQPFNSKILLGSGSISTSGTDTTDPIISSFSIPSASTTLTVPVTSFTATDNISVAGYKLTETATAPNVSDAGWSTTAPASTTFASEGTKTIYAWAKDAAGNVSTSVSRQVLITLSDVTKPVVTDFSIPSTSTSLVVAISSFTASDNKAVTGFKLTETSTTPSAGDAGWSNTTPVSYSFTTEGTKTLYAWVKDATGNVSTSVSDQVVITLPSTTSNTLGNTEVFGLATPSTQRRAMPVTFNEAGQIQSISVYHNAGTGNVLLGVYSDVAGRPSSLLGVTPSTAVRNTAGWQTISLTTPVNVASGQKVWLAWVFEKTPYVRYQATATPKSVATNSSWSSGMPSTFGSNSNANYEFSVYCTLTTSADINKPTVTAFTIPATASSLTVAVSNFTATDNAAVTGYILTESSAAPNASDAGWSTTSPASYTFDSEGTKTLYAWAKDAAGNVSVSVSGQVTITLTSTTNNTIGNTEVFGLATVSTIRRAMPVTFNEAGQIQSISVYHNAGSGKVLLGVYSDLAGRPSSLLGVTPSTAVRNTAGWQTISLTTPVNVASGQKVWLAWVFENTPYVRYQPTNTPESVATKFTWSSGMPSTFGSNSNANYKFSVYCTYATLLKEARILGNENSEPVQILSIGNENQNSNKLATEISIDSRKKNDFKIYPNPAKSILNVDYFNVPVQGTTIEIIDVNGKTIYKKLTESTSNRIEIGHLPVGLYFIRSNNVQPIIIKKFIITK